MSLSDCPKCWETPCVCGHEYLDWDDKKLLDLITLLQGALKKKNEKTEKTLNCSLCQAAGEKISEHHRDPRKCGFDANGQFTTDNYCCATLGKLNEEIRYLNDKYPLTSSALFGGDEWVLVRAFPGYLEYIDPQTGEEDKVISIILHQYKSRGRITGAWMMFDNNLMLPLDMAVAEKILKRDY